MWLGDSFYSVLVVRIVAAACLTALLGLEREARNKDAGLRTYTLVGLTSALMMVVSQYGFSGVVGPHLRADISRIAAQVVSGVGFLGAGLIFVRGNVVKGLTTAAGLWLSAGIGLAVGAGMLFIGIVSTACGLIIMRLFEYLERRINGSKKNLVILEISCHDQLGVLARISRTIAEHGFNIESVELRRDLGEGLVNMNFVLDGITDLQLLLRELSEEEGVVSVIPIRTNTRKAFLE